MIRSRVFIFLIGIFIVLFLLVGKNRVHKESWEEGIVPVNVEQDGYQYLDGYWECYSADGKESYGCLPISGNMQRTEGKECVYRIQLEGLKKEEEYVVFLYGSIHSFTAYVEDEPVFYMDDKEGKRQINPFTVDLEKCELVIKGDGIRGFTMPPVLFKWDTYQNYKNRTTALTAFFIGMYVCFLLIHVIMQRSFPHAFAYSFLIMVGYLKNVCWVILGKFTLYYPFSFEQNVVNDAIFHTIFVIYSVIICRPYLGESKKSMRLTLFILFTTVISLCLIPFGYLGWFTVIHEILTLTSLGYLSFVLLTLAVRRKNAPWRWQYSIGMIFLFVGVMGERIRMRNMASLELDLILPISIAGFLFMLVRISVEKEKDVLAYGIEKKLLMDENEQQSIQLMISQIKPHFIYNIFLVIKVLCRTDVDEAEAAIVTFSEYLRENINTIATKHPIPLSREIKHVKNYLYLEKVRFGNRIHITWNIVHDDILIPALTLQVLVENAIRHGIGKREEGGKVSITSIKDENYFIITVEDDGIGFDVDKELNDKKQTMQYSTLLNLQNRMRSTINGEITYDSKMGKGTKVTIRIPYYDK